jgi:hypothetical protein
VLGSTKVLKWRSRTNIVQSLADVFPALGKKEKLFFIFHVKDLKWIMQTLVPRVLIEFSKGY